MSQQWLHTWFPLVGMVFQVILWGTIFNRYTSPETKAIVTFSPLPGDPDF